MHKQNRSRSFRILPLVIIHSILFAQQVTLAVVDFDGYGISQTEAVALTNRLRNELFRQEKFDVVERSMMESILNEQNFQLSGCTSTECLIEVGQLLGAQNMLGGSISKVGNVYTVSARMVDVESGRLLAVSDYDLVGEIGDMLTIGMEQVALLLSGKGNSRGVDIQTKTSQAVKAAQQREEVSAPTPDGITVEDWSLSWAGDDTESRQLTHVGGMLIFGRVGGSRDVSLHPGISIGYSLRRIYSESLVKFFEDTRIYLLLDGHLRTGGMLPLDVFAGMGPGFGEYREGRYFDDDGERYLNPFISGNEYYPDPQELALVFHVGVSTKVFDFLSVGVEYFVSSASGATTFYTFGL